MKILRIFPRRTKATPTDEDVRINCYPTLLDEAGAIKELNGYIKQLHKNKNQVLII